MEIIIWKDDYSVGLVEIDDQHKKLISIINELISTVMDYGDERVMGDVLKQLADYTVYHFDTEEKYMEMFNFPGYENHRRKHKDFKIKILGFVQKHNKGEAVMDMELLEFIWNWLKAHIAVMDKEYTSCFNKHGIK
ncbi:MAG: hemerythrin family protein [Candidatus Omnitrophica bacterium]|nr:hemerythrin family protein [Candidatus Omnitrophota bacterium]